MNFTSGITGAKKRPMTRQQRRAGSLSAGMFMQRRRPPYGRLLTTRLSDPQNCHRYWGTSPDGHLSLWVLIGPCAWDTARAWIDTRLLVVAPPNEDLSQYDWQMLAGHPPVLVWPCGKVSQEQLDGLAVALIRDGVERLLVTLTKPIRYLSGKEAA